MKKVAGKVKLELAQFRELEAFTKFGSELDERTQQKIDRGFRTREVLKQGQYSPLLMEEQVVVMWALNNGYFDDVKVEDIKKTEADLLKYFKEGRKDVLKEIADKKELDEKLEKKIEKGVRDFKSTVETEKKEDDNK
jgi:F-type H+-transporting ATPase subunit alpha